jgi:hypothetical protein
VRREKLLSCFRIKADFHRKITYKRRFELAHYCMQMVGYFLPSYDSTKLAFKLAVLQVEKKLLKKAEVLKTAVCF